MRLRSKIQTGAFSTRKTFWFQGARTAKKLKDWTTCAAANMLHTVANNANSKIGPSMKGDVPTTGSLTYKKKNSHKMKTHEEESQDCEILATHAS